MEDRTLPPLSSVIGTASKGEAESRSQGWASIGAPDFPTFRPSIPMAVGPLRSLMAQSDPTVSHPSPSWQNPRDLPPMQPPQPSPADPYRPLQTAGQTQYPATPATSAPSASSTPPNQHPYAPGMPSRREPDHRIKMAVAETPYASSPGRSASHESRSSNEGLSSKPTLIPPQVVGVQEVPGEGECYVFEDGSIMKTVVGGERVNPQWGITKAGKPRKRLAQACVTCREKKIKCEQGDPRDPKCGQCARLNRVCKKPQEVQSSPEVDECAPKSGTFSNHSHPNGIEAANEPNSRKRAFADISRDHPWPQAIAPVPSSSNSVPADRPLTYANHYQVSESGSAPPKRRSRDSWRSLQPSPDLTHAEAIDTSRFNADLDPYQVNPELTMSLIEAWFRHRGDGPHLIVPSDCFRNWIRTCEQKTEDDKMLLYALMALGSLFCRNPWHRATSAALANIAELAEAQRLGVFSLQLAQTRGALVLYHYAKGNRDRQHDYVAKAVMAVKALQYHDEAGVRKGLERRHSYEYGMSAIQLAECRRRTFWTIYLFDRYTSFTYGSIGFINDLEIFLRMPNTNQNFNDGRDMQVPHFHGDSIREAHVAEPGSMALLVDIASIWGDVTSNAYRARSRSEVVYKEMYLRHWDQTAERMNRWEASLGSKYEFSADNTMRSMREGYFGDYFIIHAVHCVTGMMLGRIGRFRLLDEEIIRRNVRFSFKYARRLLSIISLLSRTTSQPYNQDIEFALSQPFPGYCILCACDIVSSGGETSELTLLPNNELAQAKKVIERIATNWTTAEQQRDTIEGRQKLLSAHGITGGVERKVIRLSDSMEKCLVPDDHDLIYGISDDLFYDVILDHAKESAP